MTTATLTTVEGPSGAPQYRVELRTVSDDASCKWCGVPLFAGDTGIVQDAERMYCCTHCASADAEGRP